MSPQRPSIISPRRSVVACAAAAALSCCASLRGAPEQASQSDSLIGSIGINTHAAFYSTPYNDWNRVIDTINDLGIRLIRDDPSDVSRLNQLTAATGAQVDLIMQDRETVPGTIDMDKLPSVIARAKQLTGLAFMEGPNEPEVLPDWETNIRNWQPALYAAVKQDPVLSSKLLISPSFGQFTIPSVMDLAPYEDGGNIHHYPPFAGPASYYLDGRIDTERQFVGPTKPIYITEGGWYNAINVQSDTWPGISESAAAKYYPAYYTEAFNRGIGKVVTYELIEETADPTQTNRETFGLLRSDWSKKPVYNTVKNFISILNDRGRDFTPSSLDYTITGGDANLRHTLLQKRDGSFELALWQDVWLYDPNNKVDLTVAPESLTLNFANAMAAAQTFLPTTSGDPTATYSGTLSQLNVSVGDQMVIVHLTPVALHTWKVNAGGNWTPADNWQNGVPNGTAVTARFGNAITVPSTVTLDTPQIVGKVTFDSANSYTIAGTAALTIDGGSAAAGALEVLSGSHAVNTPLVLGAATNITVPAGSTLTLGNSVAGDPGSSLSISGGGRVTLKQGAASVLRVGTIGISGAGTKLDLKDNRLIVTNANTIAAVTALLAAGRNSGGQGTWSGDGIVTSIASGNLTSLGIATAAQVKGISATETATWSGQTVSGTDTLVMYTYAGDANLDGKINIDDYGRIDFNVKLGTSGWYNGDFNYDGKVNVDDYGIIDFNVGVQGAPFSSAALANVTASAVPEPTFGIAAGLASLGLASSRKRKSIVSNG